jgi:hypothetical protein
VLPFFVQSKRSIQAADLIGTGTGWKIERIGIVQFVELEADIHLIVVAVLFRRLRKHIQQ